VAGPGQTMSDQPRPAAANALSARLYSYGKQPPKSLVAKRPNSGGAMLDPLPGAAEPGPALRTRLPADAALSPSNALVTNASSTSVFGDTLASFATGGKVSASQPDPALSSGPLPFNKLGRERLKHAKPEPPAPAADGFYDAAGPPAADDAADRRRDPFWFIQMLRTELSDHEFAYMNVADTDGTTWDPYNLQIVAFSDVNPNDHYTISAAGVTHCLRKGKEEMTEFTQLDQWEKECGLFQQVMKIPFFSRYQSWKAYYSWKRVIQADKIANCKAVLAQNLFVLNDTFQPSLLRVRELCVAASQLKLHQIKRGATYTLEQFTEVQEAHKVETCKKLATFYEEVRVAVQVACDTALQKFEQEVSGQDGSGAGGAQLTPRGGGGEVEVKRSFLQQAQLRSVCKKVTSYIRVVDYIVLSTLHQLLMSSLDDLLRMFKDVPLGYVEPAAADAEEEDSLVLDKKAAEKKKESAPLFQVEVYFQAPDAIEFSPSGNEFSLRLDGTISEFVNMLKTMVGTLIAHDAFKRYTQPVINGRQDQVEINEGFDIVGLIEENDEYNQMVEGIKSSFDAHFMEIIAYVQILEPHKAIYLENAAIDMSMYAESSLEEWEELLQRFIAQDVMFKAIPLAASVGIFAANNARIKDLFLPSPRRILTEIHRTLPERAAAMASTLLNETTHAQERLQNAPDNVADFVQYSEFLNTTNERQPEFAERGQAVHAMYGMMGKFSVKVPDADAASVKMMESMLGALSHLVAQVESGQEEKTTGFTEDIETGIAQLRTKADELYAESEDKSLFTADTEMIDALALLEKLDTSFQALKADSTRFAEYQEVLKVPVTRYEEVENLEGNLRLKKNMWQGLHDWGEQVDGWSTAPFESLNTEVMQQQVNKYAKICSQVEKGLPANTVLPLLKDKVDTFKSLVPVVVALRNDALKEHHWAQIEEAIHTEMDRGENFTLGYLLELHVDEYREQIETISTAATQENVLEEMLAKVEGMWKSLEFTVNMYKEQKDVFILGGMDDVMATLEETQVLVQTILGSRFVGPMQKRVDDWDKKLRLFSDTLDEWLNIQRAWMYLESIFKAADIQRQLPNEYKQFDQVNKLWLELMRKTSVDPSALKAATAPKLKEQLEKSNATLEKIQKNLEDYLETKRAAFPRFFFLSNDELLEILAEARNPQAVQPHLIKCFDNIKKLDFGDSASSIDISAMFSNEGERVPLGKNLKARGNVESWLTSVEEYMVKSLREFTKIGCGEFEEQERVPWVKTHIAQVVLTVACIYWAKEVEGRLVDETEGVDRVAALDDYNKTQIEELNESARQVGGKLTKLERATFVALITGDVHNRDIVAQMVREKVDSIGSFTWQMQLRFYWDADADDTVVRQVNSALFYGYEYQGALSRLVVTPLTDRCWMTITGALHVGLGGAPAGPAGTGKTESVKDLAKGIGRQCVVFNCSDQLDYKMMGKLFSGVVQTGCWTCLDEFNRIDIEVLSVVAQQLLTIRQALLGSVEHFVFEGREIRLKGTCGVFITMNPGYAGRTELPDNLKALFRGVSMMVPDYALIAEIMLYAEGFLEARPLAQKMVKMYKLCSEQLSQQDHYDYGMRQVKSVLVMAGGQKRANPELHESISLIRAMQEANVPRFLADDLPLFEGIIGDLYPNLEIPAVDYGMLQTAIEGAVVDAGLQVVPKFVLKAIELYQTFNVRFGVMTVGPTGGGKTACQKMLQQAQTDLKDAGNCPDPDMAQTVHTYVFNPKCITMGELYGEFNALTQEWTDGIASTMIRTAVTLTTQSDDYQWVVFDGPVDALWIENMNTVLDDNMTLCLANGERIKLNKKMHMLFEVEDLSVASPATVSRCGMVYLPPENIGWSPYVTSWIQRELFPAKDREKPMLTNELGEFLMSLFVKTAELGLKYVRSGKNEMVPTVDSQLIDSLCANFVSLLPRAKLNLEAEASTLQPVIANLFTFCFVWSVGGSLAEEAWPGFDEMVRENFGEITKFPPNGDVHDFQLLLPENEWKTWKDLLPDFVYDPKIPYFNMLVPTVDTMRFAFILERSVDVNKPALFTGHSGVGKSVIVADKMRQLVDAGAWAALPISFSAQTSALRTQEGIESKLDKKKKTLLGPPPQKRMFMFVDDVNMPALETYGASPPVELLRQFLDFGGFYDRQKLFWKNIEGVVLVSGCGPPGGGRNNLTPRYVRHHTVLALTQPSSDAMKRIFSSIMAGHLKENGNKEITDCTKPIVDSTVDLYLAVLRDLKPIPAKSHYTFNLRDVSKVIQGVLMVRAGALPSKDVLVRLWAHESMRVFCDRLIDNDDRAYFKEMIAGCTKSSFKMPWTQAEIFEGESKLVFGDFMRMGVPREDRRYEFVEDTRKIPKLFTDYLDEYNSENKEMRLVFFWDACDHVSRLARVLRQPRGNSMLVGVGGSGKQSLTRFAAYVAEMKCFQIELTKGYGYNEFREDLKKLYFWAGVDGTPVVFLFADTQIVSENFIEDINNILNSGEVPNLFANDEWEKIIGGCRKACEEAGIPTSKDNIKAFFVNRVRENLHIVLAMSPVGSAFRVRCRMFPSLINCCTIDWFDRWPEEALLSVSHQFFEILEFSEKEIETAGEKEVILKALCDMSSTIHSSVIDFSDKFFDELKRRFYVTPKSFLELISLYLAMLEEKRDEMDTSISRLSVGCKKLSETNALVQGMQEELNALQPELKTKSAEAEAMLIQVNKDQTEANKTKATVAVEEAKVKKTAEDVSKIAEDAKADLDAAMPALNSALKALDSLSKNDINEIKSFAKPPPLVQKVMECVCILLGAAITWDSAKKVLGDTQFMNKLITYDKDNIPPKIIKQITKYYDDPEFTPEVVEKVSSAAKSLCMWCRAMKIYDGVAKVVEPKKLILAESTAKLEAEQSKLKKVQDELQAVIDKVAELQATCDATVAEKTRLQDAADTTAKRLVRAGKLTGGLADEGVRWNETVATLLVERVSLIGDVFLSAAFIAYCGPFTAGYRKRVVDLWVEECNIKNIPGSEAFSLVKVMGDPLSIRDWNIWGLPVDDYSTENGILATRGKRWPLAIDPQGQANKWMRNMEQKNSCKTAKSSDTTVLRTLENAIRLGTPVILEDVREELDPALEPVLQKQIYKQGGRSLIRIGDSDIDYNEAFRFYMTTKLPNPHYLPEVCIKVTIINFTVTLEGLEDQLLGLVVREERPDLEKAKNNLVVSLAADKKQLKELEDKILRLLSASEGNILDDEVLINTLSDSKVTSGVIQGRVKEAEETEKQINATRLTYTPAATRGSILYFVIADLGNINEMYQFSLEYFSALFLDCIRRSEKSSDLGTRLTNIMEFASITIYNNVSRGVFGEHKITYSFMMTSSILRNAGAIDDADWVLFLIGAGIVDESALPACPEGVERAQWILLCMIGTKTNKLREVHKQVAQDVEAWEPLLEADTPWGVALPGELKSIDGFSRLLLIKVFRPEKLVECITEFIAEEMGKQYIEMPPLDLNEAFADAKSSVPLVFIMAPGADPMSNIVRFAADKGMSKRFHAISLGQGQGPIATQLITEASGRGDWVVLQNCHLAKSWMPKLEKIVEGFPTAPDMHPDFRLWLSSGPASYFPVPVLQSSVKMTFEPPKGLRANLKGTWASISQETLDKCAKPHEWRRLLFGLTFFHASVQERRKFGPLGWNIRYDFNNTDLEVSIETLRMFLDEQEVIPWEALEYVTGHINYGGRVTDDWDRRNLICMLRRFYLPAQLDDGYMYAADTDVYFCPADGDLDVYTKFVNGLPTTETVGLFGLHANAKISYEKQESDLVVTTVMSIQPRLGGGGGDGAGPEQIVQELSAKLSEEVPAVMKVAEAGEMTFQRNDKGDLNAIQIVLQQEMTRFNKLITRVATSLVDLGKAIKGLVVMSADLDAMFSAMLVNQVPGLWEKVSYPSLKPLSSYFKDLLERVAFMRSWLVSGQPATFALPAFFFPQGFMTGVLQMHARRYAIPIDTLNFRYEFRREETGADVVEAPVDGVLIDGFFLDGARWDRDAQQIADSHHKVMFDTLPVIHFMPAANFVRSKTDYECPLYKTAVRKGVLSTTGASSNFVVAVDMPTDRNPDYWVSMGAAMLCALAD